VSSVNPNIVKRINDIRISRLPPFPRKRKKNVTKREIDIERNIVKSLKESKSVPNFPKLRR
jgi:hypothetical protein